MGTSWWTDWCTMSMSSYSERYCVFCIHMNHSNESLNYIARGDCHAGVTGTSLPFLNTYTNWIPPQKSNSRGILSSDFRGMHSITMQPWAILYSKWCVLQERSCTLINIPVMNALLWMMVAVSCVKMVVVSSIHISTLLQQNNSISKSVYLLLMLLSIPKTGILE